MTRLELEVIVIDLQATAAGLSRCAAGGRAAPTARKIVLAVEGAVKVATGVAKV